MNKKINVLVALVIALGFAACQLDTAPRVTVKFEDPQGGNTFKEVLVEKGKSLGGQMPANLTREGPYVFYGWFDGTTQYLSDTPIGSDITLTARWSDDVATITFEFTQLGSDGKPIVPTAPIYPITLIKGSTLGSVGFPADPRSKGFDFKGWKLGDTDFTSAIAVDSDITVTAVWAETTKEELTVLFDPGPGGGDKITMKVYKGECIDEWIKRFPANPTVNTVNEEAFFVAWVDDENREYNGRTPITRNLNIIDKEQYIKGKWGMPAFIVNFDRDVKLLESSTDAAYGNVDYDPQVVDSVIDGKRAIVNTVAYDYPLNTNRWRILYRISFQLPDNFNAGFYTRYTIRARFYANEQGAQSWTDETAFTPNAPAVAAGYSEDGWLRRKTYGVTDDEGNTDYSRSDDGWGQISWTSVANWNGQGADEQTMLQRYNLDRKGGTINDTWAPLRSKELPYPPFLIIQTSDAYIGHIEITEIVFHNGNVTKDPLTDEWKYTAYEGEVKPEEPEEGE